MNEELEYEANNENPKKGNKRGISFLKEAIFYIVIFLVFIFVIPRYVAQRTVVDGNSMKDTLYDKDNLIVEKVSYYFGDPDRYDIVILHPYEGEAEYYVKRVIGLPGETIQVKNGEIYINGEVIEETYGKEVIKNPGIAKDPITLGEEEYFVFGDNRNDSIDSRELGVIKKDQIKGHVIFRMWPFKRFGTVK